MGFRLDRSYVLEFEGAMEGAYVKLRATPLGVVMRLRDGGWSTIVELADLLAEYVIEWNLDDRDDKPLPITGPAIVAELEQPVLVKIVTEWAKAAAGITAPLDPPGADGTLTDADIPMESPTS